MLFTINVIVSSTCGHVLAAPPHRTTWLKSHQEICQHLELVASNLVWKYNYNFFTSWSAPYFVASFILRRRERKSREGSASRDVNQQPVGERRGFSCLWPTEIEVTAGVTDHRANLKTREQKHKDNLSWKGRMGEPEYQTTVRQHDRSFT